jgi:hypothetical protein
MENFNLKKFLVENKLTTNSKMLNESLDAGSFILYPRTGKNSLDFRRIQYLAGIISENEFNKIKEAVVNIVSDKLSDVFDEKGIMKSEVINSINKGLDIIKKQFPDLKIIDYYVVGAAVTYQYEDGSDIDTTVVLDPATPPEKLKEVDKWIEKNLDGTMKYNARPYQFKVNFKGRNKIDSADAAYDPIKKSWIKQPNAEQAKQMYQSKIGDKGSKENILYTQLEKIVQPSLKRLYTALSAIKEAEEIKTDVAKGKIDLASFIKSAYDRYEKGIKALRGKAYDAPPESGYVSQNWGKGNVIYKMFDREGYNSAYGIMKDMVKNNKFDDPNQLSTLKIALSKVINDEPGYNP